MHAHSMSACTSISSKLVCGPVHIYACISECSCVYIYTYTHK